MDGGNGRQAGMAAGKQREEGSEQDPSPSLPVGVGGAGAVVGSKGAETEPTTGPSSLGYIYLASEV